MRDGRSPETERSRESATEKAFRIKCARTAGEERHHVSPNERHKERHKVRQLVKGGATLNEERLFILKMLEEGKINAQEAAALLEALEAGDGRKAARSRLPG